MPSPVHADAEAMEVRRGRTLRAGLASLAPYFLAFALAGLVSCARGRAQSYQLSDLQTARLQLKEREAADALNAYRAAAQAFNDEFAADKKANHWPDGVTILDENAQGYAVGIKAPVPSAVPTGPAVGQGASPITQPPVKK